VRGTSRVDVATFFCRVLVCQSSSLSPRSTCSTLCSSYDRFSSPPIFLSRRQRLTASWSLPHPAPWRRPSRSCTITAPARRSLNYPPSSDIEFSNTSNPAYFQRQPNVRNHYVRCQVYAPDSQNTGVYIVIYRVK